MARNGRVASVDLSDADACRLVEGNVHLGQSADDIFPYDKLTIKSRGDWSQLYRNRMFLNDAFVATAGFLLRQNKFAAQLKSFLTAHKLLCTDAQVFLIFTDKNKECGNVL